VVAERIAVETAAIESVQPVEVLRRELIVRELRVRQMRELRVRSGSRAQRSNGAGSAAKVAVCAGEAVRSAELSVVRAKCAGAGGCACGIAVGRECAAARRTAGEGMSALAAKRMTDETVPREAAAHSVSGKSSARMKTATSAMEAATAHAEATAAAVEAAAHMEAATAAVESTATAAMETTAVAAVSTPPPPPPRPPAVASVATPAISAALVKSARANLLFMVAPVLLKRPASNAVRTLIQKLEQCERRSGFRTRQLNLRNVAVRHSEV
jgi:hypothetical protein